MRVAERNLHKRFVRREHDALRRVLPLRLRQLERRVHAAGLVVEQVDFGRCNRRLCWFVIVIGVIVAVSVPRLEEKEGWGGEEEGDEDPNSGFELGGLPNRPAEAEGGGGDGRCLDDAGEVEARSGQTRSAEGDSDRRGREEALWRGGYGAELSEADEGQEPEGKEGRKRAVRDENRKAAQAHAGEGGGRRGTVLLKNEFLYNLYWLSCDKYNVLNAIYNNS